MAKKGEENKYDRKVLSDVQTFRWKEDLTDSQTTGKTD
jgi:hypothetical protein